MRVIIYLQNPKEKRDLWYATSIIQNERTIGIGGYGGLQYDKSRIKKIKVKL